MLTMIADINQVDKNLEMGDIRPGYLIDIIRTVGYRTIDSYRQVLFRAVRGIRDRYWTIFTIEEGRDQGICLLRVVGLVPDFR